jgi:Helix-turn-helix domain
VATDYQQRVWKEFQAGNLTRSARDVLLTLATFRGRGGALWPSHATLADRCRCCVRTVQRALEAGRDLCLVTWSERRIRSGWRWLRTSNLYRLLVPLLPVATTGHLGRRGEKKEAKSNWRVDAASLPDLLLARREAMAARLLAG